MTSRLEGVRMAASQEEPVTDLATKLE